MIRDWLTDTLRSQDIRPTPGRELVLMILASDRDAHPTAEEIYIRARGRQPDIGIATIYRSLELFIEQELVRKCEFGDGKARFELKPGPDMPEVHHHHLICKECGRIVNYDNFREEERRFLEVVERGLSTRYDFEIEGHTIRFYGRCSHCREQRKKFT